MDWEVVQLTRLISTRIDMGSEQRTVMVDLLNDAVAHLIDLHNQVKLAHWNVRGPHFIAYHELFDKVADHVTDAADMAAERATTLGGTAGATVHRIAQTTRLPEWPMNERRDSVVIRTLADRVAAVGNQVRKAIDTATEAGDAGTADLFTEISRQMDQDLWFLEAHLPE